MKTLKKLDRIIDLMIAANSGAALGFACAALMSHVKVLWLLVGVLILDLIFAVAADRIITNKIKDIKERRI